jgi:2-(1,2-epoxy-1,2-dihydrophenyl)acetyl-CoA isomerase
MEAKVLFKEEGGVAWITMNRPEVLNAWDPELIHSLVGRLSDVGQDEEVRAVVITGAGKAFSTGGDIKVQKQFLDQPLTARLERATMVQGITRHITSMEKPVIAAVNGAAVGAACDMALACDIRIASENASFGEVFIRRGLIPDMGGMFFLPRLVGLAKAKELIFSGDIIDAWEAERIGLVNKVVPADKLETETMELARRLASGPTKAIGLAKRVINKSLSTDLETSLDYALQALTICYYTEDHAEATRAFWEKREPQFNGR